MPNQSEPSKEEKLKELLTLDEIETQIAIKIADQKRDLLSKLSLKELGELRDKKK